VYFKDNILKHIKKKVFLSINATNAYL